MTKICKAIRDWAANEGMAMGSAFTELGISGASFYNWDKGMRPKPDVLKRIAERVGASPAELLDEDSPLKTVGDTQSGTQRSLPASFSDSDAVIAVIPANKVKDIQGVLNMCGAVIVGSFNGIGEKLSRSLPVCIQLAAV